ncbi:hypothetical protein ABIA31_000196 [Catenulispora sp. MAP5-51]|uniref:hypothetical protein n=1 Tax=Catenulispora sp. MAP5-51 TaxID=3156298 RepID=UPI003513286D
MPSKRPLVRTSFAVIAVALSVSAAAACSSATSTSASAQGKPAASSATSASAASMSGTSATPTHPSSSAASSPSPSTSTAAAPPASFGNPDGHAPIPAAGQPVDTSHPTTVVGDGTAAGCTSAAVVAAVAKGGVITFSCGAAPVVITMAATAKVVNTSARVVLDGGGRVTLSGGGTRRILYMNTCDKAQTWITSHCQNQSQPQLTLQNITFADGNSTGQQASGGGGGAVFASGGRLAIVNARFTGNRCDSTGPDLGGAAVRALQQYQNLPVYVVDSTFGGSAGQGGVCSNGGALSSIGVSWDVIDCVMSYNKAIGTGANPAEAGTPGGGSGGAIYTDGDDYTVTIAGTRIEHNDANEGGGAVFYVSNNRTGTLTIRDSVLDANVNDKFSTAGYPGIFFLGAGKPAVSGSSLK